MRTDRHDEAGSRFRVFVNVLKITECSGEKNVFLSISCINFRDIPVMHGNPKYLQLECLRRKTKLNSRQHGFQTHNHRHIKKVCKLFPLLVL